MRSRSSSPLVEVIEARPGIPVNWSSSGVATVEAITTGARAGQLPDTMIVGNRFGQPRPAAARRRPCQ